MNTKYLVWKILLAAVIIAGVFLIGAYFGGCTVQAQLMVFMAM